MLLGVEDLAVAKHVPEKSGRWSRVAISSKGVVATEGHLLVRVGRPKEIIDEDEFPIVEGLPVDGASEFDEVAVDARDALRMYDAVKKNKVMPLVRIVKHGDCLEGAVTDFSSAQIHKARLDTNGWPNTDALLPESKVNVAVSFSVERLAKLAKTLEAAGVKFVQLAIRHPEIGVYFVGHGKGERIVDGVIMPCFIPEDEKDKWPVTGKKWKGSDAPSPKHKADHEDETTPIPHHEMPDTTSTVETGEEAN